MYIWVNVTFLSYMAGRTDKCVCGGGGGVFGDNYPHISMKTYADEAILMSTHNICFYGEISKIIL